MFGILFVVCFRCIAFLISFPFFRVSRHVSFPQNSRNFVYYFIMQFASKFIIHRRRIISVIKFLSPQLRN